ncbi:MAG: hypothetical protein INR64_16030 [Caulobacteraceae bacterium]|nr:hypothetical protein [Caulobacter sp.]
MTHPLSEAPRFVAFSTIDDEPWDAGAEAHALLERVRDLSALGIGHVSFTEILDCGAEASEVLGQGMPLPRARERFPTLFRGGGCAPALPAVDLSGEAAPPPPPPRDP